MARLSRKGMERFYTYEGPLESLKIYWSFPKGAFKAP
jgi:hypothetical protein